MGALVQMVAQFRLGQFGSDHGRLLPDDRLSVDAFPERRRIIHVLPAGQSPQSFTVAGGGWFRRDVSGRASSIATFADHCAPPRAMVFVERRLDLHATGDIRRRGLLQSLVSADGDSWQLLRGFYDAGGCRLCAFLTFSIIRSAPLVEYPRRNGGR